MMRSESQSPLVMDRPNALSASEQVPGAGIKTILFHVYEDDAVMDRLQLALSLARACGAHLHCLHVTPIQAYTVVDSFGATFVSQEIIDAFQEQAAKLQQRIEAHLGLEDVSWDYEEITGEIVPHIVQSAALSDLVITGREPRQREFGGPAVSLCGDLLAQIRTPLFVTGDRTEDFDPFGPALVAWNGSYEAANAVRSSLPLLKMASRVQIVDFAEKKDRRFPSTNLLEYLSRHGIKADLDARSEPLGGVELGLVDYATHHGAGIIVLGGYSHSRAGEFLFGGVTRSLLKNCPVALVMAH
ncbi:MAG TPA: universal stress protein [Sphingomicrobium sp.]|nr:universal stress protein [Sphingomicrobium sp.]